MAIDVTSAEIFSAIENEALPVLVDVWAPWCGPCRMLGPVIEKLSGEVEGLAKVFKVNADDNPEFASRYSITTLPTVLIFKAGDLTSIHVGVLPPSKYKEALGIS